MRPAARGRIVVSGPDRATYLQGLLTNDIVALKPGDGCYAAYLTPQGRMLTDLFVYEVGDLILLTTPGEVTATVLAKLDQFIFAEDVRLGDVTGTFTVKGVSKDITVPVRFTYLKDKLAARTNGQAQGDLLVIRANFTIKRSDFGINPKAPGDKVAEEIELTLSLAGASPRK